MMDIGLCKVQWIHGDSEGTGYDSGGCERKDGFGFGAEHGEDNKETKKGAQGKLRWQGQCITGGDRNFGAMVKHLRGLNGGAGSGSSHG